MPMAETLYNLRPVEGGTLLDIRIRPRSSRRGAVEVREGKLVLSVHAPPEGGKANREALRLLSQMLGAPPSTLEIVRGASSRDKTVLLKGMDPTEAERTLSKYLKD